MAPLKWERAVASALRLARNRPGVMGVDFGFVYKNGKRLSTRGVRFHVGQKMPFNELPPEHILPSKVHDFRSDVVEASYSLHASARQICDPIQPGVSIGNLQRATTGTVGLGVRDRHAGGNAVLSNWHVLCGSPDAKAGEQICQPGPLHLGTRTASVVASLERWAQLDVGCDAALALMGPGISIQQTLFDTKITISGSERPGLNMKLVKYGVVSGLTHGMTDGIGGAYKVDYSSYGDTLRWIDGIRIVVDPDAPEKEISLAGDSGAVWVNPVTGKAVALHFAGEDGLGPTAEYALAQPLQRVLDLLDADLT